jgi:hypothetical protein
MPLKIADLNSMMLMGIHQSKDSKKLGTGLANQHSTAEYGNSNE